MATIFKFKEIGENLGTRMLGEKVRNILIPLIEENNKVILDFEGVNVVSNSFADECLAKLLLQMSFDELKQKTTFVSVNDYARKNIAIAFRRRLDSLSKS
ncbi:MAG: STAS-like domain-containing protein [Candidatus Cryptobacteroides sp.]